MFGSGYKGKILGLIVISCMLLLMVLGCAQETPKTATPAASAKTPIYFGVIQDLTGSVADSGRAVSAGVKMAVKEINDKGGVYGGHPVEVIERDNGMDPTKSTTAIKELISKGIVAGIMGCATTDTIPIAKACSENQIPHSFNASTVTLAQPGPDGKIYQFFYYGETIGWAKAQLIFCASKGWKKIATIYPNIAWGKWMNDATKQFIQEGNYKQQYGMEIVGEQDIDYTAKDLSAEISKVKALNPDVIFSFMLPANFPVGIRAINDMGLNVPIIGLWSNNEPGYKSMDKSMFAGRLYNYAAASETNPAYLAKYADVKKFIGGEPTGQQWCVGWQATKDFLQAIDAVGPKGSAIRDYMATKMKGQSMILGKTGAKNSITDDYKWNNVPIYSAIAPSDYPFNFINSKGEKEWIIP